VPSQMKKAELQTWLMDRGIQWEEQWLRARLMQEVDTGFSEHKFQQALVWIFA